MALAYSRHLERHPIRAVFYQSRTQVLVAALVTHESHSLAAPAPGNNSSPEYGGTSKSEAHMTPAGGSGRNSSLSGGGGLVVVSTAHDRCPRPPPTTELVELRTQVSEAAAGE